MSHKHPVFGVLSQPNSPESHGRLSFFFAFRLVCVSNTPQNQLQQRPRIMNNNDNNSSVFHRCSLHHFSLWYIIAEPKLRLKKPSILWILLGKTNAFQANGTCLCSEMEYIAFGCWLKRWPPNLMDSMGNKEWRTRNRMVCMCVRVCVYGFVYAFRPIRISRFVFPSTDRI